MSSPGFEAVPCSVRKGRYSSRWWPDTWPTTSSCQRAGGPWFPCLGRTLCHDTGTNPESRTREAGSPRSLAGPDTHLWICSRPAHHLWTEVFPHAYLHQNLVSAYLDNFYACATQPRISHPGCSISPIPFTAAFQIILVCARRMVRGVRSESGQRLPAMRSYMDDVKTLLQKATYKTVEETDL